MPDQIHNSDNLIFKSNVIVKGNLHVGDVYKIGLLEVVIPLNLTVRHILFSSPCYDQEAAGSEVFDLLKSTEKPVLIKGSNGIGKTTLAKSVFAKHRDEFYYAAKITVDTKLVEGFVNNTELISSLKLISDFKYFDNKGINVKEKFRIILNRMNQLEPIPPSFYNLLFIDDIDGNIKNQIAEADFEALLGITGKWKVLATSRRSIPGFHEYSLKISENLERPNIKSHVVNQLLLLGKHLEKLNDSRKLNVSELDKIKNQFKDKLFSSEIPSRTIYGLIKSIGSPDAESLLYFAFQMLGEDEYFEERYWIAVRLGEIKTNLAIFYLKTILNTEQNLYVLKGIKNSLF